MTAFQEVVRGRLVTPVGEVVDGVVAVEAGTISYVGPFDGWHELHPRVAVPDPLGTVLPGLVDIHCHGGGGYDVSSGDVDDVIAVAAHHALAGSTSILASLVTAAPATLLAQVRALAPMVASGDISGLHLEGPFLSRVRCGAQAAELMTDPDLGLVDDLLAVAGGAIAMMTIAPELPGAGEAATRLRLAGVTVALGHSDASYQVFRAALQALDGSAVVTHLGNAMPPLHQRAAGPVGASLVEASAGAAGVELIADGVHVDDGFVALAFAAAAKGSVVLVTDATAAAGMPDGDYPLGPRAIQVRGGVARLVPGSKAGAELSPLAGGTSHLIEVVARAVLHAGVPLVEAVRAASQTPARLVGIAGRRGALAAGYDADLLVVDDALRPVRVMRRGKWLA